MGCRRGGWRILMQDDGHFFEHLVFSEIMVICRIDLHSPIPPSSATAWRQVVCSLRGRITEAYGTFNGTFGGTFNGTFGGTFNGTFADT